MKTITAEQMKRLENEFMKRTGIPSILLMENASNGVASEVVKKDGIKRICVVCSKGNNGGDGFATARLLSVKGYAVKIVFYGKKEEATPDCRLNIELAEKLGIEIIPFSERERAESAVNESDCIIDAVIGTGFCGELRENVKNIVKMINSAKKYVVAIDCPTGANADNGNAKECVRADKTVTFYLPKTGLFLYPTAEYAGEIIISDISIPQSEKDKYKLNCNILTDSEVSELIPERKANSHKGTFGRVGLFVGSENMSGAGVICTKSAYKSGCGLVYTFSEEKTINAVNFNVPEAVAVNIGKKNGRFTAESFDNIFEKLKAVAVGCGIGEDEKTAEFLKRLVSTCRVPLILDADALNIIARDKDILNKISCPFAVTPHIAEMSRLTGKSIEYISDNMIETAVEFSLKYKAVTVLKSARTVISDSEGNVYINTTGNSALAKGGSGDMLTGTIASLVAQTGDIFKSAVLGCFINGRASETASLKRGEYGLGATEICEFIPLVIEKYCFHSNNR